MSRLFGSHMRSYIKKFRPTRITSSRNVTTQQSGHYQAYSLPPVRIFRPTIFCFTTVTAIYFALAAFEVSSEAKKYTSTWRTRPSTYEQLEAFALRMKQTRTSQPEPRTPLDILRNLPEPEKFTSGIIAANVAIHGILAAPQTSLWTTNLAHMPVAGRNYTMFTSMFVHGSTMHLALNMYCLYNFGSAVARTNTFQASGSHLAAFYLSAGLISSMGAQIEALAPSRRLYTGVGASGAIMAFIGIFATAYPDARIGILFVPGRVDASTALGLIAAFETYGAIFGIPYLKWGHSVHLAGLALGAAYGHFDKDGQIWKAVRRVAFKRLRGFNMI